MTPISSLQNAQVKEVRALRDRKERERSGLFFVAGLRAVLEAAQLRAPLDTLVVAPDALTHPRAQHLLRDWRRRGGRCLEVTADVFESLAPKAGRQGLGAVVRQQWTPLDAIPVGPGRCWVALEAVQYPGNLGTILRTCDAVGGAGVILLGPTADPYDPEAVRASVGAIFAQQLVRSNRDAFACWRRGHGITVVGTSPAAGTDYRAAAYGYPMVLLMGSEGHELAPETQALCDELVRIPMVGRSDSLNLAVATGLMLYEIFRAQQPPAAVHG
jgi:TrmH family RNA methyltransferase